MNSIQPAPISLSPLSSSSSSSHSSRSSNSSSSSSSDSEKENNDDIVNTIEDDLDEDDLGLSPNGNKGGELNRDKSNNFVSVSNKSGTLIIRRDNSVSNAKNMQVPVISPVSPSPNPQIQSQFDDNNQAAGCSSSGAQMTPSFVSYNPNSKSVLNTQNELINTNNSTSPNSSNSSVSLGVGSGVGGAMVQPLNEPQFRKSSQLPQIVSLLKPEKNVINQFFDMSFKLSRLNIKHEFNVTILLLKNFIS